MRNYRFRLSGMIPNSWFCKLKWIVTGRPRGSKRNRGQPGQHSRKQSQSPRTAERKSSATQVFLANRPSNYIASKQRLKKLPHFTTAPKVADSIFSLDPLDTPRIPKQKPCKKPLKTPVFSVSACSFPNAEFQFNPFEPLSTSKSYRVTTLENDTTTNHFDVVSKHNLRPITTKPERKELVATKLSSKQANTRKPSSGLHRIKMRSRSPRLAKKIIPASRKGLAESYVMVKASTDPQRDFMESMVEMIVENKLLGSKDLEELLACYLSLNSNEYHDIIVKVFVQIWFAFAGVIL